MLFKLISFVRSLILKHFIKIKKTDQTFLVSVRANLFMKKLAFFINIVLVFSGCGHTPATSSLPQGSIPTTTSEVLQESDSKLPEPLPLVVVRVGEAEQPMVLISKPNGDGFLLGERKGQIKIEFLILRQINLNTGSGGRVNSEIPLVNPIRAAKILDQCFDFLLEERGSFRYSSSK